MITILSCLSFHNTEFLCRWFLVPRILHKFYIFYYTKHFIENILYITKCLNIWKYSKQLTFKVRQHIQSSSFKNIQKPLDQIQTSLLYKHSYENLHSYEKSTSLLPKKSKSFYNLQKSIFSKKQHVFSEPPLQSKISNWKIDSLWTIVLEAIMKIEISLYSNSKYLL